MGSTIYNSGDFFKDPKVSARAKVQVLAGLSNGFYFEDRRPNGQLVSGFCALKKDGSQVMVVYEPGVDGSLSNGASLGAYKTANGGKVSNSLREIVGGSYGDKDVVNMVCEDLLTRYNANSKMLEEIWKDKEVNGKPVDGVESRLKKFFKHNLATSELGDMNMEDANKIIENFGGAYTTFGKKKQVAQEQVTTERVQQA